MKKDSSAVRLETAAASAPQLEVVPSSPDMSLGSEISAALQSFDEKKNRAQEMEKALSQALPEGENQAELARYNRTKDELIEWSKIMLRQLPELKELEYMSTDKAALRKISKAIDFLEDLKTKYQDIESPEAVKVRKIRSEESAGVQLRNREQIELKGQEEKARKATAVMRRELANLKRSFYKIYGMTLDEALVAPSSPSKAEEEKLKGFWNKLASQIWEKPKSEEGKKLEAVRSKTAKADIKRIQDLNKKIESTWNEVMGEYANEVEPQTSISMDTLRDVLKQEMPDKTDEELDKTADKIIRSLRLFMPEDVKVKPVEKAVDLENVHELKPARIEKVEPPVVIKEEVREKKKSQKEIPTLKIVKQEIEPETQQPTPEAELRSAMKEQDVMLKASGKGLYDYMNQLDTSNRHAREQEAGNKDRKQTAIEIMEIFGGGEQARLRGSNLFEAIKSQMNLMKIENMDPLDYVYLVAQRAKAENADDDKAAKKFDEQIQALNEKLSFGTTDPSKGINMGASRLMEARALGSTPARAEAAKMAEQISGIPKPAAETTRARKPKVEREEVIPTVRKPKSLRLVKTEEPKEEIQPVEVIPAPPEAFVNSVELKEKLDKPMDLQLAAHYVPNARYMWDAFDKAIANSPQVVSDIENLTTKLNVPDTGNTATTLVYALAEYLRIEEEFFNKKEMKVDQNIEDQIGTRVVELGQALKRIEKKAKMNIFGDDGLLKVKTWDADKMTENEIDAKYAAAQEEIPNYTGFQRALHEQVGADYETLIGKKYFAVVENYIQEVKRGDPDRIQYAENAWKALDEGLGIVHETLKDLLYSEPIQNSPMRRISKRNARSSASDKSWRQ